LRKITKREADVLRQYYGLAGTPPRTFDAIGRSLSLSGERVRQLERSALKKLRDLL
jgi:RNA polymerase primary sigma factor